jgi:uncharacterized protein HemX
MPFIGMFFGSRIGMAISAVVILSGVFFSWLAIHDHNLWNEATDVFNGMQQQLLQKKQEEFQQKTEVINQNATQIQADMAAQQAAAKKQLEDIEKQAAAETKTEKPISDDAAPYLKSIVKQLQVIYGEKKK